MNWPELLLIDKPKGITSFDVIRQLKKLYTAETGERAPKLGHAGTLDPAATGLMLIGVGAGTKKLKDLIGLDKEYVAEILLGERRSTGDMDGEVVEEARVPEISHREISGTLKTMLGTLRLPVSAFSAMKQGGEPLYKKARAGKRFVQPYRDMEILEAEFLSTQYIAINRDILSGTMTMVNELENGEQKESLENSTIDRTNRQIVEVRFVVGSGTYIRSLAEELGKRLGDYPATLYSLRRTKVGDFAISDARELTG